MMHSDSNRLKEYFETIFEILPPTNQGLIKGLVSPNWAIFSTLTTEMSNYNIDNSSAP